MGCDSLQWGDILRRAGSGRFGSVDPLPGLVGTTTLASPYHYGANDPINNVDPSGLRHDDRSLGFDSCPIDSGAAFDCLGRAGQQLPTVVVPS